MHARSSSDKAKAKAKHKEKERDPTPARLLLRVHSAKQLHHGVFSLGVYCKMYVGETALLSGSQKSLFSKMTGGHGRSHEDGHSHEGGGATESGDHSSVDTKKSGDGASATHRVFRTRTVPQPADANSVALWDENFDVIVADAAKEILSIRVKSKHRLYPSVLGVCAIPLKQLKIGHSLDRWVPLLKGTREVASLRLQLVLSPVTDPHKSAERAKPDLQADIKTALAANQSADEAIERLLASATFKSSSNRGGAVIPADSDRDNGHNHDNPHDGDPHRHHQQQQQLIGSSRDPLAVKGGAPLSAGHMTVANSA